MDLQALRSQSINKIREQFDELSGEQLTQLRAMESAEEAPRATLVKAIDDKLAELGATAAASDDASQRPSTGSGRTDGESAPLASTEDPTPPATPNGAEDAAAAPAVEAPAAPAWQAPDYCGPLTGDQAMWRVANLKAR